MPCQSSPSDSAIGILIIVATLLAFPVALTITFAFAWLNGWAPIFKEIVAEYAMIAYGCVAAVVPYVLFVILGYALISWMMSEKASTGSSKTPVEEETELNLPPSPRQAAKPRKNITKVTELSPPSSPRQQAQCEASGSPLVQSYEADWAKMEFPKLAPPVFDMEERGSPKNRERALAALKHRKSLAKVFDSQASEEAEDEVWSADWSKVRAAIAA